MNTKHSSSVLLIGTFFLLFACSEKDPTATPQPRGGEIKVHINHTVNGNTAERDQFLYMTEAGDSFQVTLLNYYLSNFEFHSPETGWKKMDKYQLIRLNEASTHDFIIKDMPFGAYDSVRFYIGLDSATNHDIDKEDELDPGNEMVWTWNTGYIFYMFEGKFVDNNNFVVPFAYHIGMDAYLMKYELPIQNVKTLSVSTTQANLELELEIDQIFRSPNLIELNNVAPVSHTFDEPALTTLLKNNLLDGFTAK
ncbi:MAG: MbnP family protein [Bacteroidia bacterium]